MRGHETTGRKSPLLHAPFRVERPDEARDVVQAVALNDAVDVVALFVLLRRLQRRGRVAHIALALHTLRPEFRECRERSGRQAEVQADERDLDAELDAEVALQPVQLV